MLQTLCGDHVSATLPSSWGPQAAWLALLIPDTLHSPGNSFSVCLKLNLTDATKSYKNFGVSVLRDYTHFPPSKWWQNVSPDNAPRLLQPDGAFSILPSPASAFPNYVTGRLHSPLLQSNAALLPGQQEPAFLRYTYTRLALRKGREGITNVLLICITFFVSHKQWIGLVCIKLTRKADKKSSCTSTNWVSDRARSKTEIFHLLLLSLYHAGNYPLFI